MQIKILSQNKVYERDYFSTERSKVYTDNIQDYHTERNNYKSVQRKKRKRSKKRLSSKKKTWK